MKEFNYITITPARSTVADYEFCYFHNGVKWMEAETFGRTNGTELASALGSGLAVEANSVIHACAILNAQAQYQS